MHIHEEESPIEQENRKKMGIACGEGFARSFFWLLFQGGKEDKGVRNYDGNKSKSLYKRSRIKSTKALIDGSVQEIAKSGKISQK